MKRIVFLLLSVLFLSACSKNDDNPKLDPQLNGSWILTDVSCFCFHDPEKDFSEYTLNFKETENTVDIQNPSEEYFYIAEDGSYNYSISNQIISIEGATYSYLYSIENNELSFHNIDDPQIADDEITLIFKRK